MAHKPRPNYPQAHCGGLLDKSISAPQAGSLFARKSGFFLPSYLGDAAAGKRNRWASFPQKTAFIHSFTRVIHSFLSFAHCYFSLSAFILSLSFSSEKRLHFTWRRPSSRRLGENEISQAPNQTKNAPLILPTMFRGMKQPDE